MKKVAGKRAASAQESTEMTGRLARKVCIITGTGGSMGRAAAQTFAREGASVVGCDVTGIDLVVDGGMKVW
jgi:hypothetical protein